MTLHRSGASGPRQLPGGLRKRIGSDAARSPGLVRALAVGLVLIVGVFSPSAVFANSPFDWPQFRESQTHQGNNPEVGTALTPSSVSSLTVAWTGATGGAVDSSPSITSGVVYVGSSDGKLYAYAAGCGTLQAACTPIWKGSTGGAITSSPAVASGDVFVGSADGKVYAFKVGCGTGGATCAADWTATTGGPIDSSPSVDQGVLFIGSSDSKVYAFDSHGVTGCSGLPKVWTATTGGAVHSSPAATNGFVYVGSDDTKLYVFSETCAAGGASCNPLWTATTGGAVRSSPSVSSGKVYVGSMDSKFYAFDAAGVTDCLGSPVVCTPLWTATTGGAITASASEGLGRIWIASEDGKVYSFSGCATLGAACTPQWTADLGHAIDSSPAYSDGVLYIGASDGKVYALQADCPTPTCSSLWSHSIGTAVKSSPTVTTGFVFVGSSDSKLYAFHLPIDHLVVSPATSSVSAGSPQTFLAEGFSSSNVDEGDVTAAANFTITGSGTCSVNVCGSTIDGTYTVTATYGTATGTATLTVVNNGSAFFPLPPTRILDTRIGQGLNDHFRSHIARTFQVTGQGGVPANATAVTGNLTVTEQTALGYLFVGPVAQNNPTSSTLNFPVSDDRANGVDVALAADGTLSVTYASPTATATAQVLFDVSGYFMPSTSGSTFHALTPTRLLDSRSGQGLSNAFANHVGRTFQVIGQGGVPGNATAVTGNLTVTQQSSKGYLFIGPNATDNPTSSTLNFPVGDDRANNVTVLLGAGGTLSITFVSPTNGQTTHAIFDVTGYFTGDTSGAKYFPVTPARLLDSRPGGTGLTNAFQSHVGRTFQVTGSTVPSTAIAVTGNLTVTEQTNLGFLYAGPVNTNQPTSSNLNFPVRDDRANGMTAMLGAGGTLSATYAAPISGPTAQVIFDVSGYFAP